MRFLGECDLVMVEASHDERLLAEGPCSSRSASLQRSDPTKLKRRIGGPFGHLNNAQTAELAAKLSGTRVRRMLLGHISVANDDPRLAFDTVRRSCRGLALDVVPSGVGRAFDMHRAPGQLSLFAAPSPPRRRG